MTLLERWDKRPWSGAGGPPDDEIRRAIAIAQAVEEAAGADSVWWVLRRADELLEVKK